MRLPIATCFVGFLKIKWVKVPRLPIAACFVGFLKIHRVKVPRKDPRVKTKRPGAAGQQKLEKKVKFDLERNLMKSIEAMGYGGSGVLPLEIEAGYADNAEGAMLAPFVRVGAAPPIKACNPAAAGESSNFDNH